MDKTESRRQTIINISYWVIAIALYYVFFRYVLRAIWPFAFALVVSLLLMPLVEKVSRKLKIKRKAVAIIFTLLFYMIIVTAAVLIIVRIVISLSDWLGDLPRLYRTTLEPYMAKLVNWYNINVTEILPEESDYLVDMGKKFLSEISKIISSLSSWAISFAQKFLTSIPSVLLASLFCVISSVYMSIDYHKIKEFVFVQVGAKGIEILRAIKRDVWDAMLHILGSYGILMVITYVELLVAFLIIKMDNAAILALVIAIFDMLPVVGTGTILIPWAIIDAIMGNYILAIQLMVIYVIVFVVRNTIEPKIVGDSVGLYPMLLLLSMYVGVKIFGAVGIIILPFTFIVLRRLNDAGLVHIFNPVVFSDESGKKVKLIDKIKQKKESKKNVKDR